MLNPQLILTFGTQLSIEGVLMELWYLKNWVTVFFILNENLLGNPEAFWRPCVNLSLFVGEDGLEGGISSQGKPQ